MQAMANIVFAMVIIFTFSVATVFCQEQEQTPEQDQTERDHQRELRCHQLFQAAKNNDLVTVKEIFTDKQQIDQVGEIILETMLMAVANGHPEVIREIINDQLAGIDLENSQDDNPNDFERWILIGFLPVSKISTVELIDLSLIWRASVKARNSAGETILMTMALYGDRPGIEKLIKLGAELDAQDDEGRTALCYAAASGNLETASALIAAGANQEIIDNKHQNAFMLAERYGYRSISQLLRRDHQRYLSPTDRIAAIRSDYELESDDNLNCELITTAEQVVWDDDSWLKLNKVRDLLFLGVNANAQNQYDETALVRASGGGIYPEMIETLLKAGADPNIKEQHGRTPLIATLAETKRDNSYLEMLYVKYLQLKVVDQLLAAGANVNAQDEDGNTVLIYAVKTFDPGANYHCRELHGDLDLVNRLLMVNGININLQNDEADSALTLAISQQNFEIVQTLIAAGADVNQRREGRPALIIAAELTDNSCDWQADKQNIRLEMVTALIAAGANINSQNENNGDTALMLAAAAGDTKLVERLIALGANTRATNFAGRTAIELATNQAIVELLK